MAKSRKLEALQAELVTVAEQPHSDRSREILQQALGSKHGVAIAQAARLVAQHGLTALVPQLVAAFERCLINPIETDPNCHAKTGIADALYRLESPQTDLFLQGIRHVQLEPVWGGRQDTAPQLRSLCALGLVRLGYFQVMSELADLLADPEIPARVGAARAIAYSQNDQGVPLLRLRIKVGDVPEVITECLIAALQLAPVASLALAAECLQDPHPQTQELTALALGETRLEAALPLLRDWWATTTDPELRQTSLLAIALLRSEAALQLLLELVVTGSSRDHADAIAALQIYQADAALWQRVEAAIAQRQAKA